MFGRDSRFTHANLLISYSSFSHMTGWIWLECWSFHRKPSVQFVDSSYFTWDQFSGIFFRRNHLFSQDAEIEIDNTKKTVKFSFNQIKCLKYLPHVNICCVAHAYNRRLKSKRRKTHKNIVPFQ